MRRPTSTPQQSLFSIYAETPRKTGWVRCAVCGLDLWAGSQFPLRQHAITHVKAGQVRQIHGKDGALDYKLIRREAADATPA